MSIFQDVFCFDDNYTLSVVNYTTQTIDVCFMRTYLLIPSYLWFTIFNGYLLSFTNDISRRFLNSKVQTIRMLTAIMFVSVLANLFVKYFLNMDTSTSVSPNMYAQASDLVFELYQLASITMHTFIVFNKNLFYFVNPISFVVTYLILVLVNLINIFNYFYLIYPIEFQKLKPYEKFFLIYLVTFNLILFLNFGVSIMIYHTKSKIKASSNNSNITNTETEQTSRFESFRDRCEYMIASCESEQGENVTKEDNANYYSYITFSWMNGLMNKGFHRQISKISDLYNLPNDLNITKIFEMFLSKYFKPLQSNDYTLNPILNTSLLKDPNFINKFCTKYEEDSLVTFEVDASRNNLLKALLMSFGRQFFLLGIIKY